ncbi:MAG: L-threonylcarbamoyladenylate synthase [Eubacteriales bacterium]|nr:L-threonylcarbamoyladenylate synthase [Eubacteriales bacterium]
MYQTEIIQADKLELAAEAVRSGGLVAFPTETVYGLGALFDSQLAVQNIFETKGRPQDNPLIVHLADIEQLAQVAEGDLALARTLFKKFSPGPLTLVLKKRETVPALVSAGLSTVAVRIPKHPLALALIEAVGKPLVAPSANTSGRPSPTSALAVLEDLAGKIPYILDGGNCLVGLESTVLDISLDKAAILRPGAIGPDELSKVLAYRPQITTIKAGQAPAAPGMKYRHYAPNVQVEIVERNVSGLLEVCALEKSPVAFLLSAKSLSKLSHSDIHEKYKRIASFAELEALQTAKSFDSEQLPLVFAYADAVQASQVLFSFFRLAEKRATKIYVEPPSAGPLADAFMNRLKKAALR